MASHVVARRDFLGRRGDLGAHRVGAGAAGAEAAARGRVDGAGDLALQVDPARLAQMRGLARFILDSADEIDLLLRRRRDAMQLDATVALREFAHAAE